MERAHHVSGRATVATWVALLALTAMSLAASRLDLGAVDLVVSLAIAIVKSGLVLMLFMHLAEERLASRMVVVLSAILVTLLVALTAADVATRHTSPPAPIAPG
jgi:cytochrome c oxidase subunit 4